MMESLVDGVTVHGRRACALAGGRAVAAWSRPPAVVEAEIDEVFKDRPDDGRDPRRSTATRSTWAPRCTTQRCWRCRWRRCAGRTAPGRTPMTFPVVTASEDAEPPADPRWAALAELRFDSEPPESLE